MRTRRCFIINRDEQVARKIGQRLRRVIYAETKINFRRSAVGEEGTKNSTTRGGANIAKSAYR